MKTKYFYFFGIGVSLLLLLLLLVGKNPSEKISWLAITHHKDVRDRNTILAESQNPTASNNHKQTAFQYIADIVHKKGFFAKGAEIDVKSGVVKWDKSSKWGELYGNPPSHSHPIAPVILKQHHVQKANPKAIQGCYQTNWGLLRLYIKDDVVVGTFNYYGRKHIIGKLKDNLLIGIWIHPSIIHPVLMAGPFQFAFSENWTSFNGTWRYKNQKQFSKVWSGKKITCPLKGAKPNKKPVPGGPGVPGKAKAKSDNQSAGTVEGSKTQTDKP